MPDRAIVFIDGNNWFHAIRDAGVHDRARLDYRLISLKLLGPRARRERRPCPVNDAGGVTRVSVARRLPRFEAELR